MSAGLRERKKVATKEALSRSAMALALERGLDAVTAESIADAAGVSVRTFRNYFGSKEDAVLHLLASEVQALAEIFTQRDPAELVLDSLEAILTTFVESSEGLERMAALTRLLTEHPALVARQVAVHEATSAAMLAEIGRRTACNPDADLYPRLVYHSATAVMRSAVELHMTTHPEGTPSRAAVVASMREGFAQLRRGIPDPRTSPKRRA